MSSSGEPEVSWKVIEAGAAVSARDGQEAGHVTRVVGDPEADVFTGLAVKPGVLGGERLVPSERVRAIYPDRVKVDLSKEELEGLPPYEDSPVVRLEPEKPGLFARLFGRR